MDKEAKRISPSWRDLAMEVVNLLRMIIWGCPMLLEALVPTVNQVPILLIGCV